MTTMQLTKGNAPMTDAEKRTLFEKIALDHFFIETLETRNSDRLDFHDCAVWAIRSALDAAFEAGRDAAAGDSK